MSYFFIGDKVNVPKYKIVGEIIDKQYRVEFEELRLKIRPDIRFCRSAYNNMWPNQTWVNYNSVKSMKPIDIYRNKTTFIESEGFESLNIPKILAKHDVVEGTVVRVVDNYFLEKMISFPEHLRLFSAISLTELLKKGDITLTGNKMNLDYGKISVQCRFKDGDCYYIYMDCLQVIKRINIFKKIYKKVFKFLEKRNFQFWLITAYLLTVTVVSIVFIVIKTYVH